MSVAKARAGFIKSAKAGWVQYCLVKCDGSTTAGQTLRFTGFQSRLLQQSEMGVASRSMVAAAAFEKAIAETMA